MNKIIWSYIIKINIIKEKHPNGCFLFIFKTNYWPNKILLNLKQSILPILMVVSRKCCKNALYPIKSFILPCLDTFFQSTILRLCLSILLLQVLLMIFRLEMLLLLYFVFWVPCSLFSECLLFLSFSSGF